MSARTTPGQSSSQKALFMAIRTSARRTGWSSIALIVYIWVRGKKSRSTRSGTRMIRIRSIEWIEKNALYKRSQLMKIVRIIARLNVGGPARHVTWLASGLVSRGFETILVAGRVPPGEEDMAYFAESNGVRPVFIDEMSRELSAKDIVSLFKLYRLFRREKPDLVHTHTAKAGTVGRAAAFFYKWLTPSVLIGRPRKVFVVHTFHGHVFHSYYGKFQNIPFYFDREIAG